MRCSEDRKIADTVEGWAWLKSHDQHMLINSRVNTPLTAGLEGEAVIVAGSFSLKIKHKIL